MMKYADLYPGQLFFWPGNSNREPGSMRRKISAQSWESVPDCSEYFRIDAERDVGYFDVIEADPQ